MQRGAVEHKAHTLELSYYILVIPLARVCCGGVASAGIGREGRLGGGEESSEEGNVGITAKEKEVKGRKREGDKKMRDGKEEGSI